MSSPEKPIDAPEARDTSGETEPANETAAAAAPAAVAPTVSTSAEVDPTAWPVSSTSVAASASAGPPATTLQDLEDEALSQYEDDVSLVTSEPPKTEDPVPMEEEVDMDEPTNSETGEQETNSSDSKDQDETMEEDQSKPEGDPLATKSETSSSEDERPSSMEEDQPKPADAQQKDEPTSMEEDQPKPDDSDDSISSTGGQLSSMDPKTSEDDILARDRPHIKMESDSDSSGTIAGEQPTMTYEDPSSGPGTPGSDSLEGATQARFKGLYRTQQLDSPSDTNSPAKSDSPVSEAPGDDAPASGEGPTAESQAVAGPSSQLSEMEKTQQLAESVDALSVTSDPEAPAKKLKTSPKRTTGLLNNGSAFLDKRAEDRAAGRPIRRIPVPIAVELAQFLPVYTEELPPRPPTPYQMEFIKFCEARKTAKGGGSVPPVPAVPVVRPQAVSPAKTEAAAKPSPRPFAGVGEDPGERKTADSATSPIRLPESSSAATSPIAVSTTEVATSPMVFEEPPKDAEGAGDVAAETVAASFSAIVTASPGKPVTSLPLKTPPKRKRSLSVSKDDPDEKSPQKVRRMDISPDPTVPGSTPVQQETEESMIEEDSSDQMKSETSKSPSKEG